MTEIALQAEHGIAIDDDKELEKQKQRAIAKCKRRVENNLELYRDGTISREEYLNLKQKAEEEIQAWESRTTDLQKIGIELKTCIAFLNHAMQLWETANAQDRQGLARMQFEYVVYDLDERHIKRFKLKSWADRFLVLRASLYDTGNGNGADNNAVKDSTRFCPYRDSETDPAPCFRSLQRSSSAGFTSASHCLTPLSPMKLREKKTAKMLSKNVTRIVKVYRLSQSVWHFGATYSPNLAWETQIVSDVVSQVGCKANDYETTLAV